jgi:hypothetical protein
MAVVSTTYSREGNFVILLDDILHLSFNKKKLLGLQSWQNPKNELLNPPVDWYFIELTFTKQTMLIEYAPENKKIWEDVLNKLKMELC